MDIKSLVKYKVEIIKISVLSVLFLMLYSPTFAMFIYDWTHDDNYSHGFLVPFIVGYLVWTKREQLQKLSPQSSRWGGVVLLGGVSVYLVGTIGAEWFLKRSSLIIVLGGLILYLYGGAIFKTLLFPLSYLIFMVPLPTIIYTWFAFKLQVLVSMVSVQFIALVGIAVHRNGNIIEIASGPLAVEEACSGMRSIMALLALSSLLAYLLYRSKLKQALLLACALPVAVITNIIRVTTTAIGAHYFGPKVAEGILHESYGGIVFIIALSLLLLVSKLLNWILPEREPA